MNSNGFDTLQKYKIKSSKSTQVTQLQNVNNKKESQSVHSFDLYENVVIKVESIVYCIRVKWLSSILPVYELSIVCT